MKGRGQGWGNSFNQFNPDHSRPPYEAVGTPNLRLLPHPNPAKSCPKPVETRLQQGRSGAEQVHKPCRNPPQTTPPNTQLHLHQQLTKKHTPADDGLPWACAVRPLACRWRATGGQVVANGV